jgi:hypothetical protein
MTQSYQLIGTVTVGSGGAANIEFTSIPSSYTDLFLVTSLRCTNTSSNNVIITFNGSSSSYTDRYLVGTGSAVASGTATAIYSRMVDSSFTANTFSNSSLYIPNYTSSNYKSTSTDAVEENNSTTALMGIAADLWSDTAAINKITLTPGSGGNIAQHSTAHLYGIGGSRATGGTITADGNYTYHTFTSTGTFTALDRIRGAEALVIAGGGGGSHAGGGGAGGLRVVPGLLLPAGNTYTVTVGSGGAGAGTTPTKGSDSVFSTITSEGGGVGKYLSGGTDGGNGGSGGGAGSDSGASARTGGVATSGQGNNGGNYTPTGNAGGGGGGAGAVGTANSSSTGGSGGVGSASYSAWGYATSTGQNVGNTYYYAGGGGGGGSTAGGSAGSGGGGAGSTGTGTAGTANTGGGGGGGWGTLGATGGSGLVIIRYPNS